MRHPRPAALSGAPSPSGLSANGVLTSHWPVKGLLGYESRRREQSPAPRSVRLSLLERDFSAPVGKAPRGDAHLGFAVRSVGDRNRETEEHEQGRCG